jgi:hypothetical protein
LVGFEYAHQRSSEAGDVPTASSLADGEVAVNSADGCLFLKKQGGEVGTIPGAVGFTRIVSLTQAEYGALSPADSATLYIVTPDPE